MAGILRDERSRASHLYRCFDAEGRLLYVGVSGNVFQRLQAYTHRCGPSWWKDVAEISLVRYERGWQALNAEVQAIKSEKPLHNKRSAGR
jgi:excinuclease UvrABC nuclease subunit